MKKKIFVSIVLALVLGLSLFAFAACGSDGVDGAQGPAGPAGSTGPPGSPGADCVCVPVDITSILTRLDTVESQLADLQNSNNNGNYAQDIADLFLEIGRLEGLIQGIPSTDHTAELASIQSTLTGLRNDLTALQNALRPTPENSRIHQLGETFYYISHGLVLFSVSVTIHPTINGSFEIVVTNYNLPNIAVNSFIILRTGDVTFANHTVGQPTNPILSREEGIFRRPINVSSDVNYFYFGTPVGGTFITAFVIFNISTMG